MEYKDFSGVSDDYLIWSMFWIEGALKLATAEYLKRHQSSQEFRDLCKEYEGSRGYGVFRGSDSKGISE